MTPQNAKIIIYITFILLVILAIDTFLRSIYFAILFYVVMGIVSIVLVVKIFRFIKKMKEKADTKREDEWL